MQRGLPAIALCALVHTAIAATPAPPAATRRGDTETVAMQTTLPRQPLAATHAEPDGEHHPAGLAMLLAAVGLMSGIVLRRRDTGPK